MLPNCLKHKTYSRLEYALKASGFHNGEGKAEANWRKFAAFIDKQFENTKDEALVEAINYIKKESPKK